MARLTGRVALASAVFLFFGIVSALVVWSAIPASSIGAFALLSQLLVMSLIGPLIFAWSWGPQPLTTLALTAAFVVPVASLAMLTLGYFRAGSHVLLAMSAVLWLGFGGLAAYMAATGGI